MHVELDGLGLFLVFEMVISQQVVELIHHWRVGVSPIWEARHLAGERARIRGGRARDSDQECCESRTLHIRTGQDRPCRP